MELKTLHKGAFYSDYVRPAKLWSSSDWKYLTDSDYRYRNETNIFIVENGKVLGAVGLMVNPYDDRVMWLLFLNIIPSEWNKGHSKTLVAAALDYSCNQMGKILRVSTYSDMGYKYLKPTFDRFREDPRYKNKIAETDEELYLELLPTGFSRPKTRSLFESSELT